MNLICPKCSPEAVFEVPKLSIKDKGEVLGICIDSPIKAVKLLMTKHDQIHKTAKFIVAHLNPKQGECHKCKSELWDKEYTHCESCKALNLNWTFC